MTQQHMTSSRVITLPHVTYRGQARGRRAKRDLSGRSPHAVAASYLVTQPSYF